MATRSETVAYILDQAAGDVPIVARKMFGEYALYADGKLVALICNDQLFIKPTAPGRAFISTVTEAPPYKGAKPSFLIAGDLLEDRGWLAKLVRLTANALPAPVKKPRKSSSGVSS